MAMETFLNAPEGYQTTRTETLTDPRMAEAQNLILNQLFGTDGGQGILSTPKAVPTYEDFVAGLDPAAKSALDLIQQQVTGPDAAGIGGYQDFLQQASTAAGSGRGMYDPSSAKAFRDEFTDQVIDRARMDIEEQADRQRRDLAARAVSQGAFGGARQAIESGQINLAEQRAVGDVSARLGSEAERFAQQQAQQAFESAAGRDLSAAGQMAGLAGAAQQLGMGDITSLLQAGQVGQGQTQAELSAQLRGLTETINQPYEQVGYATGILSGLPSFGGTQLTTAPVNEPNQLSQILGLGIAGLSAADKAGYDPFGYLRDLLPDFLFENKTGDMGPNTATG